MVETVRKKAMTMTRQCTKPSERPSLQENNEEDYDLETTCEFRSVVAKRLTEILDQRMKVTSRKSLNIHVKDDTNQEGIKLFTSSTCPLAHSDQPLTMPVRRKRTYSTSSNSSAEERLAESAVTFESIFRGRRVCSKPDSLTNGLVNKSEQLDNDVVAYKCKKKVKTKKNKHKQVNDDTSNNK